VLHDRGRGLLLRLSGAGAVAATVSCPGDVTGVAVTRDGGLLAALGAEGVVRRYGASGALEATWRIPVEAPVPAWPAGLAVDPAGELLVVDRHAGRVVVLDGGGSPRGAAARRGWEAGLLYFPGGIARLSDGRYAIVDEGNARVQVFARAAAGGEG
jgi:DNA-binding beta-propeller fold protein YncE